MFVDSDDYIAPNMLQVAYDKILSERADLLIFDFYLVSESYEVLNEKRGCTGEKIEFTLESYPEILFDCPCTWNKLYHKSLFTKNKITFPNKVWYEDLRTSTKIYTKAKKIVYLKEPLYYYYQRKSSIMHTKEYTKYLQIIDAMEDVIHYYQEQGLYKKYYNELEYLTVYQILFFYVIHINKENDKSEVQHQLTDYVIKKFPKYFKNPYYRVCFGKKERLILFFIRKSQFKLLRKCFDIKKKIDLLLKR